MADILQFPGLIHFSYQERKTSRAYKANERTFRTFLKNKRILVSKEGYLYRKGKTGVDLSQTVGRVEAWGNTKSFSTISFSSHRRKEDG